MSAVRVVKRLYRTLPVTPAAADAGKWRVQVMCSKCMVGRDFGSLNRLKRYWSDDFETIFAKVTFRCRCGSHACALRVTRPTRDSSETLLLLAGPGEYHG